MSAKTTSGGHFKNANKVPQLVEAINRAKKAGAYTFTARPADRLMNLTMLSLSVFGVAAVARGAFNMSVGRGKKEGF